jgi:hypothetical protein
MQWSSGDGINLYILAPSLPFLADTGDDVNENSIVAMLDYSGFRELFMGDAGEASEARLLAHGVDLHADVPTSRRAEGWSSRQSLRIDPGLYLNPSSQVGRDLRRSP